MESAKTKKYVKRKPIHVLKIFILHILHKNNNNEIIIIIRIDTAKGLSA